MTAPRPLLQAFSRAYPGHSPDVIVQAPGQVNLLGGHVDMHDGYVITTAINRVIWLAAAFGSADYVRLHAADMDQAATVSLKRLENHADIVGNGLPHWAQYPAGVAWALQQRGLKVNGMDAAFLGDVPMGAGLSSSSAVEMAFAVAWQAFESWRIELKELAQAGREAERGYLRLEAGIQGQFTCLHAREGQALWLDCRTLEYKHLPFPYQARVVVCDTNSRRELAVGSTYNNRAEDCHSTAHTISLVDRHVQRLRDVSLERLLDFESVLTEDQFRRSHHVITEMARVQKGAEALQNGDAAAFGQLMNESYRSAKDDYGSSSPALDTMWQAATRHPGCYGARYSGSGGGGAIIALVEAAAVDDFVKQTGTCYERMTAKTGLFFPVEPAPSAGVVI